MRFADIILPLSLPKLLTYAVPDEWAETIAAGERVEVTVGHKAYTGLVREVHTRAPEGFSVKMIAALLDSRPVVNEKQLQYWEQLADYYLCNVGDVMKAALPAGLRSAFTPKTEICVRLHPSITSEAQLLDCLNGLRRAAKQEELLLRYLSFADGVCFDRPHETPRSLLLREPSSATALAACIKKKILEQVTHEIGRLDHSAVATKELPALSAAQQQAFGQITALFDARKVALLHGVTASGKTEIYINLIAEQLRRGKQALYLLPEIALTAQIVERLQHVFGAAVGVYHSRYNDSERAEIYRAVPSPYRVILGVRSALFLPFDNLGLIIIDEEHEATYKQFDPAPRYHARDAAVMLARWHAADVLLGTATPSVESYYNALAGKYGLVTLTERYHRAPPPKTEVVNLLLARRKQCTDGLFSQHLLEAIGDALVRREQVILFQNRRGYAPYLQCADCGHIPHCTQCSVSLTCHRQGPAMRCHYCGASQPVPAICPKCHSPKMETKGFGTEKAEDLLQIHFPHARIARLDLDAVRAKDAYARILGDFAQRRIDVLVGTQMITKGLDFDNVSLVGILDADGLLNFPDFRAHERSFQLMTQVSGRAGRQQRQGRVIIQTSQSGSPVIQLVRRNDYREMFESQLVERRAFRFPPYTRLVSITLKHASEDVLRLASRQLRARLAPVMGERLTGPFQPMVSFIQGRHLLCFWLRLERSSKAADIKAFLKKQIDVVGKQKGLSGVEIIVDVDPM
ncbi:MAG: primosomal protein N' [Prevotellaceae bacterium]|jgi:primosomal protein N' (replication factor Y)|nr:primosomal protein N' [Prevotellaceae bacterium]